MDNTEPVLSCSFSFLSCIILTVLFVASLYVWNSPFDRNHPSTIKKRFFSSFCMMLLAPIFLHYTLSERSLEGSDKLTQMGVRLSGLIQAILLPLLLTAVLFLGPIIMTVLSGSWNLSTELMSWKYGLSDMMWLRDHLAAPLSEEWVFRACMMPLLLQCVRPLTAVFICPLFFGIAHFHHMIERLRSGLDFRTTIIMSCFQFSYTALFGAYSAFLFVRTGHFAAPLVAHIFCNHMGFPNFSEISQHKPTHQALIGLCFVVGLVLWCCLLPSVTDPWIYNNQLYWNY